MRKGAPLILIFLLLTSFAAAQDGGGAQTSPRRLLLSVAQAPESTFTDNDVDLIADAILLKLQQASAGYEVVDTGEKVDDDARLTVAAQAVNADCWLSISLGGGWQSMTMDIRSFDLLSRTMAVTLSLSRQGWTSPRDLSLEPWDDLTSPIAARYLPLAAAPTTVQTSVLLSVTALPGTVITGLGEPLAIGADGVGSRELPALHEYTVRASLRGHEFSKQTVFLTADRLITFSQATDPRWSLDTTIQDQGHPGLDLSWYFSPGISFLRLGVTTCMLGIALDDAAALSQEPLSMAMLQWGWYLTREDMSFSVYGGVGGFLRVVHESGTTPSIDAVSPGGIQLTAGVEIPLPKKGLFFFAEYTPTEYFTDVPVLLRASLGADAGDAGWLFESTRAFNYLSGRIGLRWVL